MKDQNWYTDNSFAKSTSPEKNSMKAREKNPYERSDSPTEHDHHHPPNEENLLEKVTISSADVMAYSFKLGTDSSGEEGRAHHSNSSNSVHLKSMFDSTGDGSISTPGTLVYQDDSSTVEDTPKAEGKNSFNAAASLTADHSDRRLRFPDQHVSMPRDRYLLLHSDGSRASSSNLKVAQRLQYEGEDLDDTSPNSLEFNDKLDIDSWLICSDSDSEVFLQDEDTNSGNKILSKTLHNESVGNFSTEANVNSVLCPSTLTTPSSDGTRSSSIPCSPSTPLSSGLEESSYKESDGVWSPESQDLNSTYASSATSSRNSNLFQYSYYVATGKDEYYNNLSDLAAPANSPNTTAEKSDFNITSSSSCFPPSTATKSGSSLTSALSGASSKTSNNTNQKPQEKLNVHRKDLNEQINRHHPIGAEATGAYAKRSQIHVVRPFISSLSSFPEETQDVVRPEPSGSNMPRPTLHRWISGTDFKQSTSRPFKDLTNDDPERMGEVVIMKPHARMRPECIGEEIANPPDLSSSSSSLPPVSAFHKPKPQQKQRRKYSDRETAVTPPKNPTAQKTAPDHDSSENSDDAIQDDHDSTFGDNTPLKLPGSAKKSLMRRFRSLKRHLSTRSRKRLSLNKKENHEVSEF